MSTDETLGLIHSMDDKAYLRPGTSEGFEKTRRGKIVTLSGEGAPQLPKYDWPEALMYQTPASHRLITKHTEEIDGKDTLVTSTDNHLVTIRPKAYVDSSGTTWASEIAEYRVQYPQLFEVTNCH